MHGQSVRLACGRCSSVRAFLGIRVGIILSTPCLSCKATKWDSPFGETAKTEAPCRSRSGTVKITRCLKVLSAEQRPKLCGPSRVFLW